MSDALESAVALLRDGGLVAYPTETVWGLAADAANPSAVAALRAWKGRDAEHPLALLCEGAASLALPEAGQRLAAAFWPGPLTLVAPGDRRLAPGVARTDGALGWRCSPHPVAAGLCRAAARAGLGPLTATSLNRSGEPPATNRAEAAVLCAGDAAPSLLADGPDAGGGPASSVVDVCGAEPVILREAALDAGRIRVALEERCCA